MEHSDLLCVQLLLECQGLRCRRVSFSKAWPLHMDDTAVYLRYFSWLKKNPCCSLRGAAGDHS